MFAALSSFVSEVKAAVARGEHDVAEVVNGHLGGLEHALETAAGDPLVKEAVDAVENATLGPGVRTVIARMLADLKGVDHELESVHDGGAVAAPPEPADVPVPPAPGAGVVPDAPPSVQAGVPEPASQELI